MCINKCQCEKDYSGMCVCFFSVLKEEWLYTGPLVSTINPVSVETNEISLWYDLN